MTEPSNPPKQSKPRNQRNQRFRYKKSQRRIEIDELNKLKSIKVFAIEQDLLQILLTPSDPEFPYQIPILDFDLHLPLHYPHNGEVKIVVNNDNIPKGIKINIEQGFATTGSLVDRVNDLDTNLEALVAKKPARTITLVRGGPRTKINLPPSPQFNQLSDSNSESGSDSESDSQIGSKDHKNSDSDSDADLEYHHESDDEDIDTGNKEVGKPKREGTEIIFDDIDLQNMALCEIVSLNLLFQCGRCKNLVEFKNIQSAEYGHASKPQAVLCTRCDLSLMVAFRKEYLHSMSHTAGYLDLTGGKPIDLLPCSYMALCGECQEQSPVIKQVDFGALRIMFCRNCHTKMSMKIEMFTFVLLSTESLSRTDVKSKKLNDGPKKQILNLTGGEPLPKNGICEHYRKSNRWFRFRCCQRVFPCDRCHDAEMSHLAEQASRMVCGSCSREQRFNDRCVHCGHDYTSRHTRFWEGGKGVRDRKLMSRKDKRKYKRDPIEKTKNTVHFKGKSNPLKSS